MGWTDLRVRRNRNVFHTYSVRDISIKTVVYSTLRPAWLGTGTPRRPCASRWGSPPPSTAGWPAQRDGRGSIHCVHYTKQEKAKKALTVHLILASKLRNRGWTTIGENLPDSLGSSPAGGRWPRPGGSTRSSSWRSGRPSWTCEARRCSPLSFVGAPGVSQNTQNTRISISIYRVSLRGCGRT